MICTAPPRPQQVDTELALSPHSNQSMPWRAAFTMDECPLTEIMVGPGRSATAGTLGRRAIPFVGTNIDFDTRNFLTRLIDSLDDFPIDHKLIAAGGCQKGVLKQLADIQQHHPDVNIYRRGSELLGCAAGWNVLLRYMNFHADIPWGIIVNSDIMAPAGSLETLSKEIWAEYDRDPLMCLGLVRQQFGDTLWSVIVYTKHAMQASGGVWGRGCGGLLRWNETYLP